MNPWRYTGGARSVLRGRALAVGGLIASSLLSCIAVCHAQQPKPSQPRGNTVPTLEALPHDPLPAGDFGGWCGPSDKVLIKVGRGTEIYQGSAKVSPLTFPNGAGLRCGDDGQKLVFVDDDAGRASEVDIPGGIVTRTLATFENKGPRKISFAPDLKKVVSSKPLTLGPAAADLKVMQLGGSRAQDIAHARWSRDSSEFFVTSIEKERVHSGIVDVFNTQNQKIGSGALPAGLTFREGWFANLQTLYFYMGSARDEFGVGVILRCRIENWKCDQIAKDVLEASVGGDGILAMVLAVGKYSSDGDWATLPPYFAAEVRNGGLQVVARQTFNSAERNDMNLKVAPSGMKAVLTWYGKSAPGCPPEKQENGTCHSGMMIDLSGRLKR